MMSAHTPGPTTMRNERLLEICRRIIEGYDYDPGDSDLDNEQPIHVSMTLGNYRELRALVHQFQRQ